MSWCETNEDELRKHMCLRRGIGATSGILNLIHEKSGFYVQQVKKNCPATYQEILDFFNGLEKDREDDPERFEKKHKAQYDEFSKQEKNRERHEYRTMKKYSGDDSIGEIRKEIPSLCCIGLSTQVRIPKEVGEDGTDITPDKDTFLREGSPKCQKPVEGDAFTDAVQYVGMISNREYSAGELAAYKRTHWRIENCLHYILDESFQEDKYRAQKGKICLSILRKFAYNIVRLIQMKGNMENRAVCHVMDMVSSGSALRLIMFLSQSHRSIKSRE